LAHVIKGSEGFPSEVAIKIAKPDLSEAERKAFENEPLTLHLLAAKLREKEGSATEGRSPIPQVLDEAFDIPGPSFFVETLAPGMPIDQHMRDRGSLPEPEVVVLGEQLAILLQALHEGLQKSYYDFQPRNLFWDLEVRHLTVVDWNILFPLTPETQRADLEHLAALLYRLAVGQPADAERLQEPEGWDRLTPGFRAFLLRSLDRRMERRHADASEMERELRKLREWWGQPPDLLVEEAERLLSRSGEGFATSTMYQDALTALEIAKRKGSGDAVSLEEELQQRWAGETLKTVQNLAQKGDVASASEVLENWRAEATVLPEQLDIERWSETLKLLSASPSAAPSFLESMAPALERLSTLTWKKWLGKELQETSGGRIVTSLLDKEEAHFLGQELAAWHFLRTAEMTPRRTAQDWRQAAEHYRKAWESANALPYGGLLKKLWGNVAQKAKALEEEAERLEKREREESEQKELQEQLRGLEDWEVVRRCDEWLKERPGNVFRSRLALEQAERLLDKGNPEAAFNLIDSIALYLAPQTFDEAMVLRNRAAEARFWREKVEWVERQWDEVLKEAAPPTMDAEQVKQIAEVAIAALFPEEPRQRAEDQGLLEKALQQWLLHRARRERWQSILGVLEASAEYLIYVRQGAPSPLSDRLQSLLFQMIASGLTPGWVRERLYNLASRVTSDPDSAKLLERAFQEGHEAEAARQQDLLARIRIDSLRRQADQLGSKGDYKEAVARIEKALEIADSLHLDGPRAVLQQDLDHYQDELFSALLQEVQRLRQERLLDLALEKAGQALQQSPSERWAEKFRREQSDLQTEKMERQLQQAVQAAKALQDQGDYDGALQGWGEALRQAEAWGNRRWILELRNRWNECQRLRDAWRKKRGEEALQAWLRTAEEAEATGLIRDLESAVESARKAMEIAHEVGSPSLVWKVQWEFQHLERKLQQVKALQQSLEEQLRSPDRRREAVGTVQTLQERYRIQGVASFGDWPVAVAFYRDVQAIEEALKDRDLRKAFERLKIWQGRRNELEDGERTTLDNLLQTYEALRVRWLQWGGASSRENRQ
jgi:tetratricopeptide (TPR) repeat protein